MGCPAGCHGLQLAALRPRGGPPELHQRDLCAPAASIVSFRALGLPRPGRREAILKNGRPNCPQGL
eukprot:3957713-Lingulodinium_polyedra.AAC.1